MAEDAGKLKAIAANLFIGDYVRHVFLCVGDACTPKGEGPPAWDMLKDETKRLGLSLATGPTACYRTKVSCLRMCAGGPVMLVYPEGTWYTGMTAERVKAVVQQHLVDGQPVEEWVFARNPLPKSEGSPSA